MFSNNLFASKTFVVFLISVALDIIIRIPALGFAPADISQLHALIATGMVSFAGKEAVQAYATDGKSSGNFKGGGQ